MSIKLSIPRNNKYRSVTILITFSDKDWIVLTISLLLSLNTHVSVALFLIQTVKLLHVKIVKHSCIHYVWGSKLTIVVSIVSSPYLLNWFMLIRGKRRCSQRSKLRIRATCQLKSILLSIHKIVHKRKGLRLLHQHKLLLRMSHLNADSGPAFRVMKELIF